MKAVTAILIGGLIAGALDILYAFAVYGPLAPALGLPSSSTLHAVLRRLASSMNDRGGSPLNDRGGSAGGCPAGRRISSGCINIKRMAACRNRTLRAAINPSPQMYRVACSSLAASVRCTASSCGATDAAPA